MVGFGSTPFGHGPFGHADRAWFNLYKLAPEIYRDNDPEGIFEKLQTAFADAHNPILRDTDDFSDLRDPSRIRTQYDNTTSLILGEEVIRLGRLIQHGRNASVTPTGYFTAVTARFRNEDVGRELVVSGSSDPRNNRRVTIVEIVSAQVAAVDPPLITDAGPLVWEFREASEAEDGVRTFEVRSGDVSEVTPGWILDDGSSQFTIVGRRRFPYGTTRLQQEGNGAYVNGAGNIVVPTGVFSFPNEGQVIALSGGGVVENNGLWTITSVVSATEVEVDGTLVEDSGYTWGLFARPELDIETLLTPAGAVVQQGNAGEVLIWTPWAPEFESEFGP